MVALSLACTTGSHVLFGALNNIASSKQAWSPGDWTSVNDHSVGGQSTSTFVISTTNKIVQLQGYLDSSKLHHHQPNIGHAGQITTNSEKVWDLSEFEGIKISYSEGDHHNYTLSMKDVLPTVLANGHERSTIDWVHTFTAEQLKVQGVGLESLQMQMPTSVFLAFKDFKPLYRNRLVENAHPLNTKHIRSFSIMIRSSDNDQAGEYSIKLHSISAAHAGTVYHTENFQC